MRIDAVDGGSSNAPPPSDQNDNSSNNNNDGQPKSKKIRLQLESYNERRIFEYKDTGEEIYLVEPSDEERFTLAIQHLDFISDVDSYPTVKKPPPPYPWAPTVDQLRYAMQEIDSVISLVDTIKDGKYLDVKPVRKNNIVDAKTLACAMASKQKYLEEASDTLLSGVSRLRRQTKSERTYVQQLSQLQRRWLLNPTMKRQGVPSVPLIDLSFSTAGSHYFRNVHAPVIRAQDIDETGGEQASSEERGRDGRADGEHEQQQHEASEEEEEEAELDFGIPLACTAGKIGLLASTIVLDDDDEDSESDNDDENEKNKEDQRNGGSGRRKQQQDMVKGYFVSMEHVLFGAQQALFKMELFEKLLSCVLKEDVNDATITTTTMIPPHAAPNPAAAAAAAAAAISLPRKSNNYPLSFQAIQFLDNQVKIKLDEGFYLECTLDADPANVFVELYPRISFSSSSSFAVSSSDNVLDGAGAGAGATSTSSSSSSNSSASSLTSVANILLQEALRKVHKNAHLSVHNVVDGIVPPRTSSSSSSSSSAIRDATYSRAPLQQQQQQQQYRGARSNQKTSRSGQSMLEVLLHLRHRFACERVYRILDADSDDGSGALRVHLLSTTYPDTSIFKVQCSLDPSSHVYVTVAGNEIFVPIRTKKHHHTTLRISPHELRAVVYSQIQQQDEATTTTPVHK